MRKIVLAMLVCLCLNGCENVIEYTEIIKEVFFYSYDGEIPEYDGNTFSIINDNIPMFTEREITNHAFETYSSLDLLGRCGTAMACVGKETMPEAERGTIGDIRPSGWHTTKYEFIDGNYLYNRCHLIGYQLTGENANEKNLITGTRHLNVQEMLPFENMIAEYIEETGNHVMYRVTPVFEGNNLIATGVVMEAYSVEDCGQGISFHVFCHNVQPGVEINYLTGYSKGADVFDDQIEMENMMQYVLNINSFKIHLPHCESVAEMSDKNKRSYHGSVEDLEKVGFSRCQNCMNCLK